MESALPLHVRDLFWRNPTSEAPGSPGSALGSDGGGTFVVGYDSAVRWDPTEATQPGRFVNSSVDLFAEFLLTTSDTRDELAAMEEKDALRAVSNARKRLQMRDPAAFADDDTWWSVVFEQLHDGFL
jgi:hypothetical protein